MAWLFLAAISGLFLFIILGFKKVTNAMGRTQKVWKINKKQNIALLALLLIIPSMMVTVPTGHTGIITTFGHVEDGTLEAGLHFILPYQRVVSMDNRAQKTTIDMSCFSSDIQEVTVVYSINYQIRKENAQTIYKAIGADYFDKIMSPRIQEAVKSVISKYSAENLIASRDDLSKQITQKLETQLSENNVIVINTAIEDLDFSDAFTAAVEEKQVAEQKKLKASIEQDQLSIEAESKAKRDVVAANAAASVAEINAEAAKKVKQTEADADAYAGDKKSEVNKKLAESLSEMLNKYYEIQQWNGELPDYFVSGTDTVLPILGNGNSQTSDK